MDGHDGHTAGAGAAGHGLLPGGACLRGGVNGTDEAGDAVCPGPGAEGSEPPGILPALGAVLHHAQRGQIARGRKDFFEQLFHRHTPGHPAQLGQPGIERPDLLFKGAFFGAVHGQQQCPVQAHPLAVLRCRRLPCRLLCGTAGLVLLFLQFLRAGTEADQVVVREAKQRAQHGGGKIDILRRVVDDLQQRDQGPDVGRIQQIFAGVRINRDAVGGQGLHIGWEVAARRQQDAAILVLHRAGGAAVPHLLPGGHQGFDLPGDALRVRLGGVVGQEAGLHTARIFARCAADQPLTVAVGRIAQGGGHELLKQEVDASHHFRRTAEVRIQRQQRVLAGRSFRRAGAGRAAGQERPGIQLFPEDAGVCLPEAVDALFQIAHKEEIVPGGRSQTAVECVL